MSTHVTGMSAEQALNTQEAQVAPILRRRSRLEAWLFLIPALGFQIIWGWYPLLFGIITSFTDAQPILPSRFVGIENYLRVWQDPLTVRSFQVTFMYAVLSIVLTFITPIIVAILLMEMPPRVMRWMMLLWFLPLSSISGTVLWRYVYDNNVGLFQYIATDILKMPPQLFLNDPNGVLFWLIFPGVLLFGPGLIYMTALQGISESYYEAAEVEGASFFRKVWTITLPRIRPIISMLLTFSIIGSLQTFEWPQIMTGGNPGGASRTVVMYLYEYITNVRYADATALAVTLFAVIMALTIAFRALFKEDLDA